MIRLVTCSILLCACLVSGGCGDEVLGSSTQADASASDLRPQRCDLSCPVGELCLGSKCVCDGTTRCGRDCIDTTRDHDNCGACGNACEANQLCANSQCALMCPVGLTGCNGKCTDLLTDVLNCGACGKACGMGQVCAVGKCG